MKILQLRKMGMDFYYDHQKTISDCGNYRLRAEFTDKQGHDVTADFTGFWRNTLNVSASFTDTRSGYSYRYKPLEEQTRGKVYCLNHILKAVNSVSEEQYENVEVTE